MSDESQPIIVKKIKKGGGHHGGAWKVAYADFVTAMMALFIVLWILGSSEEVKEAVSSYFNDPTGIPIPGAEALNKNPNLLIEPEIEDEILFREREKRRLEKMGDEIMSDLEGDSEYLGLMDQIQVEIVDEGLRIELVESSEDVFFKLGSAQLDDKATVIMEKVGKRLSGLSNDIVIEGHTDSRPLTSRGGMYTNYELSADRANSARRALMKGGLKESQIDEIRGYADKRLKDKKDPFSVVNRRISIIVKFSEKK
jgi:chemotaxis protein MotB